MRKVILLFALIVTATASAADEPCPPRWSYIGETGPARWGSLDPNWKACSSGLLQSPVDLTRLPTSPDSTLPFLVQQYPTAATVNVSNTSRALKVYPTTSVQILRDNVPFVLEEFHFHVPKEHITSTSAGALAELHLVHKSVDGRQTVVIAVFIAEGARNDELQKIIDKKPAACAPQNPAGNVNLQRLLPGNINRYFTYIGSLTTPACDEGLIWIVLNDPIRATQPQISALRVLANNSRTLQQPRMRFRS